MTLTPDVMFVNRNEFTITSERKLKFVTVDYIPSWTVGQGSKILIEVIQLYVIVGFIIHVILMDMEFE